MEELFMKFIWVLGFATSIFGALGFFAVVSMWATDRFIAAFSFQREIIAWAIDRRKTKRVKG